MRLNRVAVQEGFEPSTLGIKTRCANQLRHWTLYQNILEQLNIMQCSSHIYFHHGVDCLRIVTLR